jgi:hypothetical protein
MSKASSLLCGGSLNELARPGAKEIAVNFQRPPRVGDASQSNWMASGWRRAHCYLACLCHLVMQNWLSIHRSLQDFKYLICFA